MISLRVDHSVNVDVHSRGWRGWHYRYDNNVRWRRRWRGWWWWSGYPIHVGGMHRGAAAILLGLAGRQVASVPSGFLAMGSGVVVRMTVALLVVFVTVAVRFIFIFVCGPG